MGLNLDAIASIPTFYRLFAYSLMLRLLCTNHLEYHLERNSNPRC